MTPSALYFVTGSSGSGKTTLLQRAAKAFTPPLRVMHVDALGASSSPRAWAARAAGGGDGPLLIVDGQVRPAEVLEAAREAGLRHSHVVLIDCGHAERKRRLLHDRKQPELDHLDMYAWAAYLRGQADALGIEILDTTGRTVDETVGLLCESIERFADRAGVDMSSGARR